jgi:hypothetical protein
MEKCLEIAKLLGEENVEKIKNSVTDMLIDRCREELEDMAIYMVDYERMFDEIQDEVKAIMKNRIKNKYLEMAEGKFSELFGNKE